MKNKIVEENTDIFLCPDTRSELMFVKKNENEGNFINKNETKFGSTKGFVDFVGDFSGKSVLSKKSKEKDFAYWYDRIMDSPKWYYKVINKLLWKQDLNVKKFQKIVRVFLTEMGDGTYLDLPIRTANISQDIYKEFMKSTFVGVDYSADLLSCAYDRLHSKNIENAVLVHANPTKLPFRESVFDGIISFNSFNFFKDYEVIISELFRAAKPGAKITGTCYVKERNKTTDKLVEKFLLPRDILKSTFTKQELLKALQSAGFTDIVIAVFNEDPLQQFSAKKPGSLNSNES